MINQMSNSFDVISVGDAIIDAFLGIHEANTHCRVDEKTHELCIRSGEKIPVDSCEFLLGGNACNVGVGFSRMGFTTALCAEIGDDEFSQKIINGLGKEQISNHLVQQTKGASSSFAIGINFKRERTLFVEHIVRRHDFSFTNVSAKWVYLSSLGKEWEGAYAKTLEFVQKSGARLAFNPGTPQLQEGYGAIANILSHTEILFLNKEEAQKLLSCSDGCECSNNKEIKDLMADLHGLGPKIVVITDGKNGSYASDSSSYAYTLGIFDHPVIERTGAGDAYTSGFLSAIIGGESIQNAMRAGTINAASVIGKVGAQPGLLTKLEMEKKLLEHVDLQVKELT